MRFDADPLFMATKDLREPYLAGIDDTSDEYMERVEEGGAGELTS